ncbi:nitrogenase-stabilizing/protective protein NifW [Rhabdochromatium marinum]|uniref:nitrogenase-stabilizing/protective protein NifW n=1 Tax=Rhabdochromatium marinum TaxID=48729 RepID=UPI001904AF72|nr:nitrogenase-stabilizing/protective protein NifW [Rhabdochromatium marinum]MBK1647204.1 nitrogen fixation protein NifW [Rhabdochromatium marinum]
MMDQTQDFNLEDLDELETAEDFLDYFRIPYEPAIVQVKRLHILQRFHDYIAQIDCMPAEGAERFALHRDLLQGAYRDFVHSDAKTEKVFRVFQSQPPVTVGLDGLLAGMPHASGV